MIKFSAYSRIGLLIALEQGKYQCKMIGIGNAGRRVSLAGPLIILPKSEKEAIIAYAAGAASGFYKHWAQAHVPILFDAEAFGKNEARNSVYHSFYEEAIQTATRLLEKTGGRKEWHITIGTRGPEFEVQISRGAWGRREFVKDTLFGVTSTVSVFFYAAGFQEVLDTFFGGVTFMKRDAGLFTQDLIEQPAGFQWSAVDCFKSGELAAAGWQPKMRSDAELWGRGKNNTPNIVMH